MKVYIAGKITGEPNYKAHFQLGADAMKLEGHTALNPARLPEGMAPADYMKVCFAMIDIADAVAFLPGWHSSRGAGLEYEYCLYIGRQVIFLENRPSFLALSKQERRRHEEVD